MTTADYLQLGASVFLLASPYVCEWWALRRKDE